MDIFAIYRSVGLAALAVVSASARPMVLDNGLIRVAVAPELGGAVTAVTLEKAVSFPLIADKGAGVAGTGTLFAPIVECGGNIARKFALQQTASTEDTLTLSASLSGLAPGLEWRRRIALAVGQTSLVIEDTLINNSGQEVRVHVGSD